MPRPESPSPARRDTALAPSPLCGEDPRFLEALRVAERAAMSEFSVLILGETGTGKELIARTVHDHSPRSRGPFVPLNCGAIPAELIESELFGHERGAFTGALAPRQGLFAEADGGTLFLDEVGELPRAHQPRLLRALETGRVRRVGSRGESAVDVRVVAATHRGAGRGYAPSPLRLDLYHRLATVVVEVPPLRARRRDILLLARRFLDELEPAFGPRHLTPESARALAAHSWPGNIRELKNAIRRAVVLCDDVLTPEALFGGAAASLSPIGESHEGPGGGARAGEDWRGPRPARRRADPTQAREHPGPAPDEPAPHEEADLLDAMRRAYAHFGSIRGAARALAMPKSTFADRARRYGIVPAERPRVTPVAGAGA